jgi:hypothetical protein
MNLPLLSLKEGVSNCRHPIDINMAVVKMSAVEGGGEVILAPLSVKEGRIV